MQLWLREDEPALGWDEPGATVSAYEAPFNTWASMPQLIDVERWPGDGPSADDRLLLRRAGGALAARPAPGRVPRGAPGARPGQRRRAGRAAGWRTCCPGRRRAGRSGGSLLCGRDGHAGRDAIDTQLHLANVDPSDRYVRCAPGSDVHRLRADESGYDNLVLAGDWTDNGLNAGCIEAATLSGLQAANAVLGRSRSHRIAGTWLS